MPGWKKIPESEIQSIQNYLTELLELKIEDVDIPIEEVCKLESILKKLKDINLED